MGAERAERCGTCRFRESILVLDPGGKWRPDMHPGGLTEAEYEKRHDDPSGECHRYPPRVRRPGFPPVYLEDWCGEWKPAG